LIPPSREARIKSKLIKAFGETFVDINEKVMAYYGLAADSDR